MKEVISTDRAPKAIGPYSQAVMTNGIIFISGQLPVDMATGELENENIKKATANCLNNISAILEQGGATLDDIVKKTIFLTDLSDFASVNEVYSSFFTIAQPTRSCVQVAGLPRAAKIEIEAIAIPDKEPHVLQVQK